jgi:uncharacterized membrane protein YoaK (UPF0700 family)
VLLCFVAGFVDAFGYFRLGEVFTANMTGNTVLFSMALARADWAKAIVCVWTLGSFFLGSLAAALVKRLFLRDFPVLLLAAALLVATIQIDLPARVALAVLAFVMGLQGGCISNFGGQRVQTIVLTSSIVRLAETGVARLWPVPGDEPIRSATVGLFALVWISYGAGAVASGVTGHFLRWPLAVPALLLVVAALDLLRRRARPGHHQK